MGQEQPKYHVADDGKVFVVNDDGTSTEYGYVLKRRRMLIPNYVTRVRDKRVKIDEICEVDKSKDGQWYDRL